MSKFVAGHVTKIWFFTSFRPQILLLNFKANVEKMMWLRLQHMATMLEGKSMPSNYFVEKSKCYKISPLNAFPLKFLV